MIFMTLCWVVFYGIMIGVTAAILDITVGKSEDYYDRPPNLLVAVIWPIALPAAVAWWMVSYLFSDR